MEHKINKRLFKKLQFFLSDDDYKFEVNEGFLSIKFNKSLLTKKLQECLSQFFDYKSESEDILEYHSKLDVGEVLSSINSNILLSILYYPDIIDCIYLINTIEEDRYYKDSVMQFEIKMKKKLFEYLSNDSKNFLEQRFRVDMHALKESSDHYTLISNG